MVLDPRRSADGEGAAAEKMNDRGTIMMSNTEAQIFPKVFVPPGVCGIRPRRKAPQNVAVAVDVVSEGNAV